MDGDPAPCKASPDDKACGSMAAASSRTDRPDAASRHGHENLE
jgi:hypothetical protein